MLINLFYINEGKLERRRDENFRKGENYEWKDNVT